MKELAMELYDMATDIDYRDYEETKENDILLILRDLESLPKDSALLQCLEMIVNRFQLFSARPVQPGSRQQARCGLFPSPQG